MTGSGSSALRPDGPTIASKTGARVVPLPRAAAEVLAGLPRVAGNSEWATSSQPMKCALRRIKRETGLDLAALEQRLTAMRA